MEFKLTKPRKTTSFKPSFKIGPNCKRMMGLTSSEENIYIFHITEEIKKFKRSQQYNDRFPWSSIKHNETEPSLIRIESEIL